MLSTKVAFSSLRLPIVATLSLGQHSLLPSLSLCTRHHGALTHTVSQPTHSQPTLSVSLTTAPKLQARSYSDSDCSMSRLCRFRTSSTSIIHAHSSIRLSARRQSLCDGEQSLEAGSGPGSYYSYSAVAVAAAAAAAAAGARGSSMKYSTFTATSVAAATSPTSPTSPTSANHGIQHPSMPYVQHLVSQYRSDLNVDEASTPPAEWYRDEYFAKFEKHAIFGRNWTVVGRVDQLQKAGDYFTGCLLGEPFVVVKSDDDQIRAFFNTCRHHGTRVADDAGFLQQGKFVCPYHGWEYNLQGRLTKATRMKGIKHFRASQHGLIPIAVNISEPWIFLHITSDRHDGSGSGSGSGRDSGRGSDSDSDSKKSLSNESTPGPGRGSVGGSVGGSAPPIPPIAPAFDDFMGSLPHQLAATNHDNLRFLKQVVYDMDCNWKVFIDNYLDGGYHVPHAHGALSNDLDLESYYTELHKYHSVQSCPSSDTSTVRLSGDAFYAFLYPNFMINRYGPWMDTNLVWPISADKCRVIFDYYLDESKLSDLHFIEDSLSSSHKVQLEDMYLCDSVQQGLNSSYGYNTGRYVPGVEFPMYHFHQLLHHDMNAQLGSWQRVETF
jgi:choline monooxygenase